MLDLFAPHLELKYFSKFVCNGAKDMGHLQALLKTLDVDEITKRMGAFFQSTDPFVVTARHPIGLFASGINKLGAAKPAAATQRSGQLQAQPALPQRHRPHAPQHGEAQSR